MFHVKHSFPQLNFQTQKKGQIKRIEMTNLSLIHFSIPILFAINTSFPKKFKRETGINFKTYVVTAQVLYAQELIDTTDLPITEIAFRCGFPDSNYFSTVFKRITQLAPSQYASYSRKHKIK